MIQCNDGKDNDGNGLKDYPEDPSCTSEFDETEDGIPTPQCKNEKDDDGDGRTDYPNDPGCFAPQQDSEEDDCPDGPGCPQCANGIDDDMNGSTDFPSDGGGCTSASDIEEYTSNPNACGSGIVFKKIPFTGKTSGTLMAGAPSRLQATCGGTGTEDIYEIRVLVPKVIVATTNTDSSTADTVLSLRSANCMDAMSEIACNDNVDASDKQSTLTASISTPGTYFLIVDSKDAVGGAYELEVNYFIGEGTQCVAPDECGPGLVCRIPKNGTQKICTKHVCEDGLDDDNDTKIDYPHDPGCTSPTDDDEADGCPGAGPNCPECGDGIDNDNDTKIDYGNNGDDTCTSASSSSESCLASEGVAALTMASTMGTTVGQVDDVKLPNTCQSSTSTARDMTYRLDLPAMASLTIANVNNFDASVALLPQSCTGAPIDCKDSPEDLTFGALTAGTYYYVVDGWGADTASYTGTFTINISGQIAPLGSCTSPLATAGAITCSLGYSCQAGTCQPAVCFDGINQTNGDSDNVADYPDDPGCDSPADNDEANPAMMPQCKDGMDNDGDTLTDYPADYGCAAASGTTEAFCTGEVDPTAKITAKVTTGTTTGLNNNWKGVCAASTHTAPDKAFALILPVPVATLKMDTDGSAFDTTLVFKSLDCATEIACDDEGGVLTNTSALTRNGVAPGGYAVIVDGWTSQNGAFTLNVQGTVAPNTRCDSALFSGGANAVLVCPTGTTCTGAPIPRCQ